MQSSLNPRTLLSTTIADALDLFRGRVDLGDRAFLSSLHSVGGGLSPLDGDRQGEDGRGKARLKSKMRWNG